MVSTGVAALEPTVHESELGYWEMHPQAPSPELAPFVQRIDGYLQRMAVTSSGRHRQMPSTRLPFIISIGEPLGVMTPHGEQVHAYQGFVAGLHDSYATTEFRSEMCGVQTDFSPLGMQMLLGGMPMHEITNRVYRVDDVFGIDGRVLVERLQEQPDWNARFGLIEEFVAGRLRGAPRPAEDVGYAWYRLTETSGCITIGSLADEMGYSRKQLIERFRQHIGMPPKLVARILRFQHARELLAHDDTTWSDVAFNAGYYDQSHLIRDFVEFSGSSPTDYVARLLPNRGGMRAE